MGWRAVSVRPAIRSGRPVRPPPPHVQPLLAVVAPLRQKLRPGGGHGDDCRGDARVPGGADTAAERAADPGVRPALGVWGSDVPCVACVSAGPGASACLKSTGFGVLASCLEPVPLLKVELLFPSLVLLVPPTPSLVISVSPGAFQKCSLSPTPDLLNQNLCFNTLSRSQNTH